LTNTGATAEAITAVSTSPPFSVAHSCATLEAGGSCIAQVRFTPKSEGSSAGELSVSSAGGAQAVPLAGAGERSLVTHYYRAILRRAPDAGGKAYWDSEAARMGGLGANVNETWYAMAMSFFGSPEYAGFNRDDAGFVTDLYATFFNREPDGGGLAFWSGQIASGMPREVVLTAFLFSPEFTDFTRQVFGDTAVRREMDTVVDFYRGLFSRLPDDAGFSSWLGAFRTAQCQGDQYVMAQAAAMSAGFATGAEYAARKRSDAQFVGDLYNAFLRRGGDLEGVQFWIGELSSSRQSRDQVRAAFLASPEFRGRVKAMVDEGCALPGYRADFDVAGNLIPAPTGPAGAAMCEFPGNPPSPGGGHGPCGAHQIPVDTCSSGMKGENAITAAWLYVLEDYYPGSPRIGNSLRFGLRRDNAMVFRFRTGETGLYDFPRYVTMGYEEQVNRGPLAPRFVTLSEKKCDFDYTKTYVDGGMNGCYKTMSGGDSMLAQITATGSDPSVRFPYCQLKPNTVYYLNIRYEDAATPANRGRISCPTGMNAFDTCGQTIGVN
ncbi:MAG: DUF4214 domain-containing protein, partial [Lysobacter sp.]|nr:DUF4214 domain-containing protein [Lysobacter sp.]